MDATTLWGVVVVLAVGGALAIWWAWRRQRTTALRRRFGAEYERAVHERGSVAKAEAALQAREERVARLEIRKLSPEDAARFSRDWRSVQARFVDDPEGAITEGDRLVGELMHARGYPVGDFEQQLDDISVDHAGVVMHYRAARDIAQDRARGRTSTEDLRQAMVHYRALFDELLEVTPEKTRMSHALPADTGASDRAETSRGTR